MNKISLILTLFLLLLPLSPATSQTGRIPHLLEYGAVVRGDTSKADLALVFTGDEFADGGIHIASVLSAQGVKGSFFFTGKFYRNPDFKSLIDTLRNKGHYLGAHSDQHLLYCSWENRDSLLLTRQQFQDDLLENYRIMETYNIRKEDAIFFLPPYEWYNDSISTWTGQMGLKLVNFTQGTLSHADYTLPASKNYRSSEEIYRSILDHEETVANRLNGFILLTHIGTAPERSDKFYFYLEKLIEELKAKGYRFKRIDELLKQNL